MSVCQTLNFSGVNPRYEFRREWRELVLKDCNISGKYALTKNTSGIQVVLLIFHCLKKSTNIGKPVCKYGAHTLLIESDEHIQYVRSCGKVMFLRLSVSHSVHGGVYPSMHWGRHPLGRHSPAQCMLGYTHPVPPAATAADGTHPTGMHSCLHKNITQFERCLWISSKVRFHRHRVW